MDRLNRALAGGCLAVALGMAVSASGCRSARNDVPPGKPYSTTGGTPPTIGFNSDPPRNTAVGSGMYANGMTPGSPSPNGPSGLAGSGSGALGTPNPSAGNFAAPSGDRYGPPGTSGAGNP
jgi:hypothetical protein